jgi:FAD/FMN-containing dehydrogenase/Fe-S oxidoreductase
MDNASPKFPVWTDLSKALSGSLHTDKKTRAIYATDASIYRKLPAAVAVPSSDEDLGHLVRFAGEFKMPLIPRTAGTSLAGQCVGEGLVVDFSRHFSAILEINAQEKWVRVQPGVIRDELNRALATVGLFFGPNTSTASRCMIGGMVGNNSCGTTSIKYGTTRDKVIEIDAILSDGSKATFGPKDSDAIQNILSEDSLEADIYRQLIEKLGNQEVQNEIRQKFPKPSIHRRNTGYAVDVLLNHAPFRVDGLPLNLAKLIAGSEGTLCLISSVKIAVDALPPPQVAVVCAHFSSVLEAMKATVVAMERAPFACELMDRTILELTKDNPEQAENRFFVEGDPGAIIAVELRADREDALEEEISALIESLKAAGFGYAFPVVRHLDVGRVWALRAAGLGVLSNMKGAAKPVAFVEDTAVDLKDLPAYIEEFEALMEGFGQSAVYYAHAGAGELHLRPVLNLKSAEGQKQLREIGKASAALVKKYGGSLSGEHGDGRVRAEFISSMIGPKNYELIREIKQKWDPNGIFNPGKIVDAPPMNVDLRYEAGQKPFATDTFLDFSSKGDMLQAAEACNGSGDCRKPSASGATMCPSYQATLNEFDSTRARANLLREVLTHPENPAYPLGSESIHEVLDLCLSCKACKRECPSSVDVATLKAESNYQYQRRNGLPFRSKFFGHFHKQAAIASLAPRMANGLLKAPPVLNWFRNVVGIDKRRTIPEFSLKKATKAITNSRPVSDADLVLYIDEFTQYQDAQIGAAAGRVLQKLGYTIHVYYAPSARAYISKAMLPEARLAAQKILSGLGEAIELGLPVVGVEPSAILGFRDEFPILVDVGFRESAKALSRLTHTFEEFIAKQVQDGKISSDQFTLDKADVRLHLHCHQKALSNVSYSKIALGLPANYRVEVIPSGCCGMAGSFGYETEHYPISMQIGELVLFPSVRALEGATIIAASGTSCRHQIADGTQRKALHVAEILERALKES